MKSFKTKHVQPIAGRVKTTTDAIHIWIQPIKENYRSKNHFNLELWIFIGPHSVTKQGIYKICSEGHNTENKRFCLIVMIIVTVKSSVRDFIHWFSEY